MCSMAVRRRAPGRRRLVLLSYPLHPPGRPDNLRTEHLPALTVPVPVRAGHAGSVRHARRARRTATATIPGPVTHEWIDGGRHDLKGADRRIGELVAAWLSGLGRS